MDIIDGSPPLRNSTYVPEWRVTNKQQLDLSLGLANVNLLGMETVQLNDGRGF